MIKRELLKQVEKQLKQVPVVAITGPRQSGKTTLSKKVGKGFQYYNLEDIPTKSRILEDPAGFINQIEGPVIIDEIQKIPELLSQIQVSVDESKKIGQFIITGSESLLLSEKISQSLAGRVVNNTLLPLSYEELKDQKQEEKNINKQIIKGFYPRIYETNMDSLTFYQGYLSTYVEKDVRQIQNIGNLSIFEKFLQILAGRVGQLLNLTSIGNDLGISHGTVEKWISILEASYIVYRLQPHFVNIGKRLVKSPKVYFYDTGLLCYLLGIHQEKDLKNYFNYGSIFENFVISETYKHIYNNKLSSKLYFFRDSNGLEIDMIVDGGIKQLGIEIKSAQTISSDFLKSIEVYRPNLNVEFKGGIVYTGVSENNIRDIEIYNINNLKRLFNQIK